MEAEFRGKAGARTLLLDAAAGCAGEKHGWITGLGADHCSRKASCCVQKTFKREPQTHAQRSNEDTGGKTESGGREIGLKRAKGRWKTKRNEAADGRRTEWWRRGRTRIDVVGPVDRETGSHSKLRRHQILLGISWSTLHP